MENFPLIPEQINDFLTERERSFLEKVFEFCRTEIDPYTAQWDEEERFPREIFEKAGQNGLAGIAMPENYGGKGLSLTAFALAIREIGRHDPAFALNLAAQNTLSVGHIIAYGSDEQINRYAVKQITGEWIGAWALTEPNAGSDTNNMESVATPKADGFWEITGHKMFITQGRTADVLVVMATTGTTPKGRKEISAFIVEKSQVEGIRKIPTYGMRASETSEIRLDKARAELLGEQGTGQSQALGLLDKGRIGVAALAAGIGQAAMDTAIQFSLQRQQFGRKIADFQSIQNKLADSAVDLDAAVMLILKAAAMQDRGMKTVKESAVAKLFASEAATRICNRAMQICAGRGYSRDMKVERFLRDAKICEIGEGTSEIQRIVISRNLLKEAQASMNL